MRRKQKVLERLHDGFARVQKGLEVSSRGGVHVYKRSLNNVKMVLFMEQFGPEVTSKKKSPITLITDLG